MKSGNDNKKNSSGNINKYSAGTKDSKNNVDLDNHDNRNNVKEEQLNFNDIFAKYSHINYSPKLELMEYSRNYKVENNKPIIIAISNGAINSSPKVENNKKEPSRLNELFLKYPFINYKPGFELMKYSKKFKAEKEDPITIDNLKSNSSHTQKAQNEQHELHVSQPKLSQENTQESDANKVEGQNTFQISKDKDNDKSFEQQQQLKDEPSKQAKKATTWSELDIKPEKNDIPQTFKRQDPQLAKKDNLSNSSNAQNAHSKQHSKHFNSYNDQRTGTKNSRSTLQKQTHNPIKQANENKNQKNENEDQKIEFINIKEESQKTKSLIQTKKDEEKKGDSTANDQKDEAIKPKALTQSQKDEINSYKNGHKDQPSGPSITIPNTHAANVWSKALISNTNDPSLNYDDTDEYKRVSQQLKTSHAKKPNIENNQNQQLEDKQYQSKRPKSPAQNNKISTTHESNEENQAKQPKEAFDSQKLSHQAPKNPKANSAWDIVWAMPNPKENALKEHRDAPKRKQNIKVKFNNTTKNGNTNSTVHKNSNNSSVVSPQSFNYESPSLESPTNKPNTDNIQINHNSQNHEEIIASKQQDHTVQENTVQVSTRAQSPWSSFVIEPFDDSKGISKIQSNLHDAHKDPNVSTSKNSTSPRTNNSKKTKQ